MKTAFFYLGFAALGYFIGARFRSKKDSFGWLGRLLTFVVFSLITCMGYKIGSSESIINDIKEIGINSAILTVVPLIFTIIALSITRRLVGYNAKGELVPREERKKLREGKEPEKKGKTVIPKTTFLYVAGVIAGFIFGYIMVVRTGIIDFEKGYSVVGIYITYALYLMVFLVGVDLGFDGNAPKLIKQAGVKTLIFPLVVGIATLLGVFACTIFMDYDAHDALMIGGTFCWYSLAPNIIIDGGYVATGAVAFLCNFFRVILTLITVPIVAQKIGYVETTGMAVAASMDVCIGTIESSTNKTCAIIAFVTGCVYTFIIPVTMPIIVSMNF